MNMSAFLAGASKQAGDILQSREKSRLELMLKSKQIEAEMNARIQQDMAMGVGADEAAFIRRQAGMENAPRTPMGAQAFSTWAGLDRSQVAASAALAAKLAGDNKKTFFTPEEANQQLGYQAFDPTSKDGVPIDKFREYRASAARKVGTADQRNSLANTSAFLAKLKDFRNSLARLQKKNLTGPVSGRINSLITKALQGDSISSDELNNAEIRAFMGDQMNVLVDLTRQTQGMKASDKDAIRTGIQIPDLVTGKIASSKMIDSLIRNANNHYNAMKQQAPITEHMQRFGTESWKYKLGEGEKSVKSVSDLIKEIKNNSRSQ